MCVTDLDPDLELTDIGSTDLDGIDLDSSNLDSTEHRTEGKYAGVAWGRLAERRDGQDDLDGQDVAKPRA